MMTRIRVVLADDHAVVRKGIHDFLVEEGDIDVVAEASDGEMVKQLILEHRPDVVILDVRMPGATGIEVTRWVREQGLPLKVLILTAYDDRPFVTAALQAGANGYVLKNADAEQIAAAVRAVFYGYAAFDPAVTAKALTQGPGAGSRAAATVEPLTERPGKMMEPLNFDAIKHELFEKLERPVTEFDALAYALYPKVFLDYSSYVERYGDISVLDTSTFFHGMRR